MGLRLVWLLDRPPFGPLGGFFFHGGFSIAVYSIRVAYVNDRIEHEELAAAASGLILANAVGSILGPISAGLLMARMRTAGFFVFSASAQLAYAGYSGDCITRRPPAKEEAREADVTVPGATGTTHAALPLHKHGPGEPEGKKAPE